MSKKTGKITVLYLIDTFLSPSGSASKGGAEKQLHLLATSLDAGQFRSIVVQLDPFVLPPVSEGTLGPARIHHLPTPKFYNFHGYRRVREIAKIARDEGVDIIHTFFEKSEVMGWVVSRLAGTPVWVTSRRDLGFKRRRAYDFVFRRTSHDCSCCVANCDAVKQQVHEREGLPMSKIVTIYNGMDYSGYTRVLDKEQAKMWLGYDSSKPLVGMIANLNFEIKGHRFFLEAARIILSRIPEACFLLVGEGKLRTRYEELARSLGISDSVKFLGKRSDIPLITAALDVSVLCSTSEGLSNVIMESMASGTPVVATRIGGNPELVGEGVNGFLVPPADSPSLAIAIEDLLRAPVKAKELGQAGQQVVREKFTIEAMVENYERLYRSLLMTSREGGDR